MEFQAVVMAAGTGSRMTDLTSRCPKALLPVGNYPLLWYPVNALERAGFEEVIVVVLESFVGEAQRLLCEVCDVKIKIDFVCIPDSDYLGTADSLRSIKDKIKTDVLVVSCDLISDISLHQVANIHRAYDSSITMLLSPLPEQYADVPAPGVKSRKKAERDFIGFDESGKRVLFLTSEADLEEYITFKKSLLKKHPYINIRSRITDCHLYFMKKWVVNFVAENKKISTIKGELIPYLVKKQFSKSKPLEVPQPDVSLASMDTKSDIHSFTSEDQLTRMVRDLSTWIDHEGDMEECFHGDNIRCYAYIQEEGFCVRVNTLGTYCEANRQIPRLLGTLAPNKEINNIHPSTTIKEKSQIGSDCLVSEGVSIGERVSVKRSVIGRHCSLGDKVKVANSVIMDHVSILEGSTITGSIVCDRATICEKCELKDCIVGHSKTIIAMGKFTNEAIIDVDKMMEI
ncbi:translation initiation factor eIF-2B subunit gamma-like [Gigantopelta aegis]|uniref:translation initiation factor eIF-2B subunit gamma-like n=1 Tax=Gigantopelta aegis TaxID=1735272 RepID=UPI001B88CC42|nr:translation initiation factor eIF-2B subunit gamma-like [Gigantopelta aegis]XP_041359480.1 translation initiation factor eIF-2B subunit gamma-like [Gigantopelta aegis]